MDMREREQKSEIVGMDLTLLANFTHQVINPLNGVVGTLDNLVDGTISPENREQRTRAACAQLENCITLVRNLAYLASGESAFSYSDVRTVALPQVIIEAMQFYQEEGRRRRISIGLTNRWDQNMINGHPETLKQSLMNIFDNCIKYSRIGSEVKVEQWIQKRSNWAIISITSTPEHSPTASDLTNMFKLGFRGSNAKKIVSSGTGLGLHICKLLIEERHKGTISVQYNRNGLLFTIKIPEAWRQSP